MVRFFYQAKKRVEEQLSKLGFGRTKSKHGGFEEVADLSRRNSFDLDNSQESQAAASYFVKETRLVNIKTVRDGMLRFAFLLEACNPGTIPDPPLLAAALDLVRRARRLSFDEDMSSILSREIFL